MSETPQGDDEKALPAKPEDRPEAKPTGEKQAAKNRDTEAPA